MYNNARKLPIKLGKIIHILIHIMYIYEDIYRAILFLFHDDDIKL